MIRWMNRVPLARDMALLLGIALPLLMVCGVYPVLWTMGWLAGGVPEDDPFAMTRAFGSFALAAGALVFGVIRVRQTHPHSNDDLRHMLAAGPWHWPLPLPFGPVRLTLQDVVAVVIATAWADLLLQSFWPTVVFATLMLVGYCWSVAAICEATGVPRAATGITLLGAGAVAFVLTPWLAAVCLVLACVVAHWGIVESLKRFHAWSGQLDDGEKIPTDWTWAGKSKAAGSLGWPHGLLNPVRRGAIVPVRKALRECMLVGVWIWAFCHLFVTFEATTPRTEYDFSGFDVRPWYLIPIGIGLVTGLWRLLTYLSGVTPPLSLWGRLRNRRLFLRGYDEVFFVPLLVVGLGCLLPVIGLRLSIPLEVYLPVTTATLLLIATAAGPTLEEWRLTSRVHLRDPYFRGSDRMMQTP